MFIISIAWHDTPENVVFDEGGTRWFWILVFVQHSVSWSSSIIQLSYSLLCCCVCPVSWSATRSTVTLADLLLATIKYLNIRYLNILDIQISCVCKHSFLPNNSWSTTRSTPADLLYCPQFKYSQQWRSSHQSNFLLTEEEKIP